MRAKLNECRPMMELASATTVSTPEFFLISALSVKPLAVSSFAASLYPLSIPVTGPSLLFVFSHFHHHSHLHLRFMFYTVNVYVCTSAFFFFILNMCWWFYAGILENQGNSDHLGMTENICFKLLISLVVDSC